MASSDMSESDGGDENCDAWRLERISALADGQLLGEEFVQAADAAVHDPEARAAWHVYHVVGDALRMGETAYGASDGFAARFAARLAREAPLRHPAVAPPTIVTVAAQETARATAAGNSSDHADRLSQREPAANNPVFRWKMVAGLAMGVAVGTVGWNLFDTGLAPSGQLAQLAGVSGFQSRSAPGVQGRSPDQRGSSTDAAPVLAHNVAPSMIRDPRLDELLAAHEQSGGVSALQMPAGFLRNATFEGRGR